MMRHHPPYIRLLGFCFWLICAARGLAADRLEFLPPEAHAAGLHVVLVAGDEEYRTEESMPMLAKILSQKHGFRCTVLFAFGPDGADYIDPNSRGIRGWDGYEADLMIIGTRFRQPSCRGRAHLTEFLNARKPVIGTARPRMLTARVILAGCPMINSD